MEKNGGFSTAPLVPLINSGGRQYNHPRNDCQVYISEVLSEYSRIVVDEFAEAIQELTKTMNQVEGMLDKTSGKNNCKK